MPLWFHDIQQGRLSTELLGIRLESGGFAPFVGQGFLKWTAKTGVRIRALTNGGQALSRDSFGHLQMHLGSLIPPDAYLRLTATTRDDSSIAIERLFFGGYDYSNSHDTVVWSIGRSEVASVVDFRRGEVAENVEFVSFLLSNAEGLVLPRVSPSGQWCLQCKTAIGKITAYLRNGHLLVNVEPDAPQRLDRIIDAVSFAFCFWAGKILPVVAYEARYGDAILCRLYPLNKLRTRMETPPFGHTISLSFETYHEVLLQRAIDYFANDERGIIGPLIHTRLSCPDAPFSVGLLVLCSALEGIAKEISKSTGVSEEIAPALKVNVQTCFKDSGLSDEMTGRFLSFVSKVNAPTAANAISRWCSEGFLAFSAEDKKAWDYRNKTAHGNFALLGNNFDERKVSVARRDRLGNMINKLVMHAIGYDGKYLDYATYREQDFPPKPGALTILTSEA